MAKPWSEVETSKEYQNLSTQEQSQAKQEYFNTVVTTKSEFKDLSDSDKISAQQEFMGETQQLQQQRPSILAQLTRSVMQNTPMEQFKTSQYGYQQNIPSPQENQSLEDYQKVFAQQLQPRETEIARQGTIPQFSDLMQVGLLAGGAEAEAAGTGIKLLKSLGKFGLLEGIAETTGLNKAIKSIPQPELQDLSDIIKFGLEGYLAAKPWKTSQAVKFAENKLIGWDKTKAVMGKMFGKGVGEEVNTIQKYSWNEVEKIGKMEQNITTPDGYPVTYRAPDIVGNKWKEGIGQSKQNLSNMFDLVLSKVDEKSFPQENVNPFIEHLQSLVDKIKDPTSKTTLVFEGERQKLGGDYRQAIKDLPKNIQKQVLGATQRTEFIPVDPITGLPAVKEKQASILATELDMLRRAMWDTVSAKDWRNRQDAPFDAKIAMKIGNEIGEFIGDNYRPYKQVVNQWRKMKDIESEIYDLSSKDLARPWNNQEATLKTNMLNIYNKIDTYFSQRGMQGYMGKDMLAKYHAYTAVANPQIYGLSKVYPIRIALGYLGSVIGGAMVPGVGGPIGKIAGGVAGWKLASPEAWVPLLKNLTTKVKK